MLRFYEKNREALIYPLTVTNDTPFHIAVYNTSKSPLQELLHIFPNNALIAKANDKKNTPLHEAGAIGNMEAAQLLVRFSPEQLEAKNALGETPFFRAAAFGMTEMVKYLASEVRSRHCDMQIQRIRDDNTSILHSAIHGQHFVTLVVKAIYIIWTSRGSTASGKETALWLLRNDEILEDLMDNKGRTCLQLLANIKSAFKSGYPMCRFESFIYFSITGMYSSWWMFLAAGWPMIGKIQNKKKKHESSWKLAKLLIKKDRSWEKTHTKPDIGIISFGETEGSESEKEGVVGKKEEKKGNNDNVNPLPFPTTPLLIATSTGIEEIVNGILKEHPQAVEHVSDEGLNIMHVAIRHRQRNIFKRVKKMKILMVRLVRKIDDNGYTLLHHVSDMTHYYSSGSLPNAALQLQDELK
ncbi:hypothetical protein FEM48_Zijuj01G0074500 [Ziziphus jujuba var. spinosa]|uniref:Uncharacterized protein n=1 Tax=Ziziphus jujuba var. spinosa TaxID=714518 RepID=A0A978VZX3_ZIZJJ|nr:hypothetical protein FEM48_Zijuj01G0074500 [Ziziphus jujuba var. spinosa]